MSGYIGVQPVPQSTQTHETFTATSGQTSFATAGYTPGFLQVFLNGVKLVNGDDFTATNGSDVVLTVGAASGDTVEVLSFSTFEVNSQTFTGDTSAVNLNVTGTFTSRGIDDNATSTAMTLDASGNLLVGKTVNNDTGAGFRVNSNFISSVGDGAISGYFHRLTSDGDIVQFRKDGTTVGSIGAFDTDLFIGNSGIAARFDNVLNAITPFNNNTLANSDNLIDVGSSARRFKDLYLSGGVYLGGTGAANKLDDYETGTWTPSFSGGVSSVTYSTQSGVYTKIGDLVVCKMRLTMSAFTGDANFLTIQGLPFAVESVTAQTGGTAPMLDNLTATVNNITLQPTTGAATFVFITGNGGTGSHSGLRGNQCTVNTDMRATIIYQTT